MLDRRLDRLAMELHASAANRTALERGGYYLPVEVIRRTLELMVSAGTFSLPAASDQEPALFDSRRVVTGEHRSRY